MCTCARRASGTLKVPRGASTCRNVLDFWHAMQCWAHFLTSFRMPGHVKREVRAFTVAHTPWCDNPWIALNTAQRCSAGMNSRVMCETSHTISPPVAISGTFWSTVPGCWFEFRSVCNSGSLCWACAIDGPEIDCDFCNVTSLQWCW